MNEEKPKLTWNRDEALAFCVRLEKYLLSAEVKCHVALTGGCLYSEGERKDMDIILYPHKDKDGCEEQTAMFHAVLFGLDMNPGDIKAYEQRVYKTTYHGRNIDMFLLGFSK